MRKILSVVLSFGLLFQQSGLLYAAGEINLANYLSQARSAIVQPDQFRPAQLRYISYDIKSNDFKLLLDKGGAKLNELSNSLNSSTPKLNDATQELFNYFLIGLSLPNDTFWVNLRPDAPENIIDPLLEKTDIGKIFLEADLQLKKDTASLTSPQNPEGKLYWDKLYKKAGELFGTENITIPTITRPWIVPNEVIVRETEDSAYIYKATLKVMLEADYLNGRGGSRTAPTPDQYVFSDPRLKELNEYSTQLIRETIIPKLTKEINSSKRYAQLRQVYYSLVLARWFKQKYSSLGSAGASANSYLGLIDSGNLDNLVSQQPCDKQTYFHAYQKSFKDGEYNLKETVSTPFGQSIRSYISGGLGMGFPYKTVNSPVMGIKVNSSPVTNILTEQQPPVTTASPLTAEEEKLINEIITATSEGEFKGVSEEILYRIGTIIKEITGVEVEIRAEDLDKSIMDLRGLEKLDSLYWLEFIALLGKYSGVELLEDREDREDIEKKLGESVNKIVEDLRGRMSKENGGEFKGLLKLICRIEVDDLLKKVPMGAPKDKISEIKESIKEDKIGDAAFELGRVFLALAQKDYKTADACNLIRNAWQSVTTASPITAKQFEMIVQHISASSDSFEVKAASIVEYWLTLKSGEEKKSIYSGNIREIFGKFINLGGFRGGDATINYIMEFIESKLRANKEYLSDQWNNEVFASVIFHSNSKENNEQIEISKRLQEALNVKSLEDAEAIVEKLIKKYPGSKVAFSDNTYKNILAKIIPIEMLLSLFMKYDEQQEILGNTVEDVIKDAHASIVGTDKIRLDGLRDPEKVGIGVERILKKIFKAVQEAKSQNIPPEITSDESLKLAQEVFIITSQKDKTYRYRELIGAHIIGVFEEFLKNKSGGVNVKDMQIEIEAAFSGYIRENVVGFLITFIRNNINNPYGKFIGEGQALHRLIGELKGEAQEEVLGQTHYSVKKLLSIINKLSKLSEDTRLETAEENLLLIQEVTAAGSPLTVMEARNIINELKMLNFVFYYSDITTEKDLKEKLESLRENRNELLEGISEEDGISVDEIDIDLHSNSLKAWLELPLQLLGIIVRNEENYKMEMDGSKLREYFEGKDDMSNKVQDFIMAIDEFNREHIALKIKEKIDEFLRVKNLSTNVSDISIEFERRVFAIARITFKADSPDVDIFEELLNVVGKLGDGFRIGGILTAKYEKPNVLVMSLPLSSRIPNLLDFYHFKEEVVSIYERVYRLSKAVFPHKESVLEVLLRINNEIMKGEYSQIKSLGEYLIRVAVPELLKECKAPRNKTEINLIRMLEKVIEKTRTLCEENDVSSSLTTNEGASSEISYSDLKKGLGGIDLTDRMLKIKLERVGSFASSALILPEITNLEALDLDKEYERIQAMVSSSIRPSDTRILEFAAACYYREEFDQRLAQVSSCIKSAHLADEISGRDSSPALRLATMLPDALYGG